MTPETLLETLQSLPAETPLVFRTDEGRIGGGYHVTEFKLAQISSIDCGGRLASWTESTLQLLDGADGKHMAVGKFSAILEQSITKLAGLGDTNFRVEFSHKNNGLKTYQVAVPDFVDGVVAVQLTEERAHCKPALEAVMSADTVSCCGASGTTRCCQ